MYRTAFLLLCLGLLLFPLLVDPAAAQAPQEKRIALVVGDGNYEKTPLATAANDAGLIAQTLQAAGFDVIGARDLDADGLNHSFHDFIEKVQADPANTVAISISPATHPARRRELLHSGRFQDQPRYRHPDRRIADQRLHARTCLHSGQGQHRRAQCGTAAALHRGRQPDCRWPWTMDASPNMLIAFNAAPERSL